MVSTALREKRLLKRGASGRRSGNTQVPWPSFEKQLKRHGSFESWLSTLFQFSSDVITVLDAYHTIQYESPSASRILGYTAVERAGTDFFEMVHPDDAPAVRAAFTQILLMESEITTQIEFRFRHAGGSWLYLEAVGCNLLSEESICGIVVTAHDITVRKQMEDDLRSRARLLDVAPDSILVYNKTGKFVYVNEEACRLRGYDRDELLQMNLRDLVTPEEAKRLPERLRTLAEHGEIHFESVERCRDGSLLSSEVHSKACGHGDRELVFSIARDISSRKEAEERRRITDEHLEMLVEERTLAYAVANDELERECAERRRAEADRAEREERYRLLFDAGTDAVMVFSTTKDGELHAFLEANGVAVERYGYTKDELERLSPLAIVVDIDREKVTEAVKTLRDREHLVIETMHQTKGGFVFPVEVSISRFMLRGVPTVLSIARDITERKMLDEMEKKAFEQIEKNITQFAILNDQLRNPLAVIVGLADLEGGPTAEKILHQAKVIDEMITRLDQGWIESEKVREFLKKHYYTQASG